MKFCEMNNKSVCAFYSALFWLYFEYRVLFFTVFKLLHTLENENGTPLMQAKHVAEIRPILTCKNVMFSHANSFYV